VTEAGLGLDDDAKPPRGTQQRVEGEAAEHDDHAQVRLRQLELTHEPHSAALPLVGGRLVVRRSTAYRRGDTQADQRLTVLAMA
jgi:hypothetical protein